MSESPPDNPDRSDASSQELLLSHLMQAMNDVVVDELGIAGVVVDEHFQILQALGDFRSFVQLPERGFSTRLTDVLPEPLLQPIKTVIQRTEEEGSFTVTSPPVRYGEVLKQVRITARLHNQKINSKQCYLITFIPRTQLSTSERLFSSIFQHSTTPMLAVNENGIIEMVNIQLCRMLSYDESELIGQSVDILLPVRHREGHAQYLADYMKMPRVRSMGEGRDLFALTKKGSEIPVEIGLNPLDSDNKLVVASLFDLTIRKLTEKELKDTYQVLQQVLEGAAAGYWDWMIQAGTEYLSPTFKSMFGYEDHEIENSPEAWQRIIHPDDLPGVFACFEKHVASRGEVPFDNEVRYFHKDGSIVWVYCRGKVIEWDDSDPKDVKPVRMVGCHVDITRLKHIQETLEISNQELTQFAYVASHDLQEPLRTINSFVTLIQKEYGDTLDGDAVEYFSFIAESAQRMSNLTMDLLEYSRIGHEKKKGPVKLNEVISQVMDDMRATLKSSSAEFLLDDLPAIQGYESELRLLFQNLFSNAIKFTRKERVPMITVQCEKIAGAYRVTVKDNGIGIEPRYQDRIFQIFQRLHSRKKYEGTGIGLAACKKVVELHGGQIEVISDPENKPEEGTTFRFTLTR